MGLDQALKKLTTGIYVVTSKQGSEINGMVASWVSQVSFSPPLIMVAIKQGRYSHGMIEQGKVFAINQRVEQGNGRNVFYAVKGQKAQLVQQELNGLLFVNDVKIWKMIYYYKNYRL